MLARITRLFRPDPSQSCVRWVNRDLAIGCPVDEADWQAIRSRGVRGVVDVSDGTSDLGHVVRRQGMRYLRLAVTDGRLPEAEELHIVTSWVLQRVCEEGPVLVHEAEGRGNHALVAGAALIKRGASLRRATLQLKGALSEALTDAQLDLLVRFAGEMSPASRRG